MTYKELCKILNEELSEGIITYLHGESGLKIRLTFSEIKKFKCEQESLKKEIIEFVKKYNGKIISRPNYYCIIAEFKQARLEEVKEVFEKKAEAARRNNMITRTWKVYGATGHRQKISFQASFKWDFTKDDNIRIIEVDNSDITGTNDYSVVRITRNTAEECENELIGQISDGIFENVRVGKFEEVEEA